MSQHEKPSELQNQTAQDQATLNAPIMTVSRTVAFWFWFKLGWISFGGPAGQIAIMHQELVERRGWISERRFLHALNYCMLLPGPEAQQLATYLGWLMHRNLGGIIAGVLFVLPSFFILVLLAWLYLVYGHNPIMAGIFSGIQPAVVVIVLHAAYRMGKKTLKHIFLVLIALFSFIALMLKLPFPAILMVAAVLGLAGAHYFPEVFEQKQAHGHDSAGQTALIDDQTETPDHAQVNIQKTLWMLCIFALLWFFPMAALLLYWGWLHDYTQLSWFFTKAALLTFGGAYAVLPYVYQGAVQHYHWVSPTQMMDGLALGESTPGPLIMVVTFVGFIAGYQHLLLGAEYPFLAGLLAATLVTWFTFLPSFAFILMGAPLIEASRQQLKLNAPLMAISAAVVGVVVHLAYFLAQHVIFAPVTQNINFLALVLMAVVAFLLFYAKRSIPQVLVVAALLGLLMSIF